MGHLERGRSAVRFVELVWMPFVDESLRDLASVRQAANLITQFKALNLNFLEQTAKTTALLQNCRSCSLSTKCGSLGGIHLQLYHPIFTYFQWVSWLDHPTRLVDLDLHFSHPDMKVPGSEPRVFGPKPASATSGRYPAALLGQHNRSAAQATELDTTKPRNATTWV